VIDRSGTNLSGDELTTAARQGQKNTATQDQAGQSGTDDGARDRNLDGKQLRSELSTGEIRSVDVKVGLSAFYSRDQRRLSACDRPAIGRDSPGAGTVTVQLDTTAQTISILASFFGLTAPDTAAHIHCCQTIPGTNTNVGVATTMPTFA
jgi:hypothetical protein